MCLLVLIGLHLTIPHVRRGEPQLTQAPPVSQTDAYFLNGFLLVKQAPSVVSMSTPES